MTLSNPKPHGVHYKRTLITCGCGTVFHPEGHGVAYYCKECADAIHRYDSKMWYRKKKALTA